MLRVLACCLPITWGSAPSPAISDYDGPHDDGQAGELTGALRHVLAKGDVVLVVTPERDDEIHERVLRVSAALDTARLVVHRSSLPPLGVAALIRALDELATTDGIPPTLVASAVGRLEASVRTAAWLGSVTGLSRPAPTLWQHVRSWFPGSSFVATLDGTGSLRTVPRDHDRLPVPAVDDPAGWFGLIAVGQDLTAPTPRTDRPPIQQVELPAQSASWWGTDQLVEVAVGPTGRQLLEVLRQAGAATCDWCRATVSELPCALCGSAAGVGRIPAAVHPS